MAIYDLFNLDKSDDQNSPQQSSVAAPSAKQTHGGHAFFANASQSASERGYAEPKHRTLDEERETVAMRAPDELAKEARDRFFSTLVTRLFFFLLLLGDCFWTVYALFLFLFASVGSALTMKKVRYFCTLKETAWISLRRALVCGISLFIALFSPAFGIMVACTYFLMYDKSGIEEVVPASLQSQFREFMPHPVEESEG
ncbi:MAG: hypothetical protein V4492_05810 [Chlamydiota bacterium]